MIFFHNFNNYQTIDFIIIPDSIKPIGVPNQTIDASLFYIRLEWLNDVREFLKIGQIESMLLMQ
jgi:hypothetical protein